MSRWVRVVLFFHPHLPCGLLAPQHDSLAMAAPDAFRDSRAHDLVVAGLLKVWEKVAADAPVIGLSSEVACGPALQHIPPLIQFFSLDQIVWHKAHGPWDFTFKESASGIQHGNCFDVHDASLWFGCCATGVKYTQFHRETNPPLGPSFLIAYPRVCRTVIPIAVGQGSGGLSDRFLARMGMLSDNIEIRIQA